VKQNEDDTPVSPAATRIKLKTRAQRTVPADFTARLIRAHRECPWTDRGDASITIGK
jgi:hypothetical protein